MRPPSAISSTTRDSSVPLSICDPDRSRRLEAVDEIKRTLDMAEYVSFPFLVQHLGSSRDAADPRLFEAAFNSLEHLRIFAKQRGVTIALENTRGELATPANLRQFLAETRLGGVSLCFDIGHAHLGDGVEKSLEEMRDLVVTAHIHDNHGVKDEHLPPCETESSDSEPTGGTIDWKAAFAIMPAVPLVFELSNRHGAEPTPASGGFAGRSAQILRSRRRSIGRRAPDGITEHARRHHRSHRRISRPGSHHPRLAL